MAPFSTRFPSLSKKFKSKAKHGRKETKNMEKSFKRLKSDMEEISEEQKNIREGQRQVKEKFKVIESECEELKRETGLIIQQSARTQVKLALMFRIIKAREAGELSVAANLTDILRTNMKTSLWLVLMVKNCLPTPTRYSPNHLSPTPQFSRNERKKCKLRVRQIAVLMNIGKDAKAGEENNNLWDNWKQLSIKGSS